MKPNILIINASIRGQQGNSYAIALTAKNYLEKTQNANLEIYDLTHPKKTLQEVYSLLENADGFIVISGTYWNNISSNLQRFIEVCTPFENTNAFFGKPLSTIISMDSVGGIEVANRITSSFSGLGCWTPPCSTIILSRIGEEAVRQTQEWDDDPNEDVWRIEDIEILIDNLIIASQFERKQWRVWPNIQLQLKDGEWPESGDLDMGNLKFL